MTEEELKQACHQIGVSITEAQSIEVYQSGQLVRSTARLAELAASAEAEEDRMALIEATYVTAAAALEALLMEAASILAPSIYSEKKFRMAGAPQKYKMLKGKDSDAIGRIWKTRNALTHGEPDNERTRLVGEDLTVEDARQVVIILNNLARDIWGPAMPEWFRKDSRTMA